MKRLLTDNLRDNGAFRLVCNRLLVKLEDLRLYERRGIRKNSHHAVHLSGIALILLISHILVIFLACIDIQAGKDAADVIQTGKNVIQRFCTLFHCSLFCAERFYFLRKLLLCFLKFFITTKQTRKIPAVRRIHLFSFFQFNFCHISPFIHLFRRNYFCGFSSNTNVPHLRLVYHNLTSKSKIFS